MNPAYARPQEADFAQAHREGAEWVADFFSSIGRGIGWAWNQTPASWPVWWRIGLIVAVTFAVIGVTRLMVDHIKGRFRRRAVHGVARFARLKELRSNGLLGKVGRFLGTLEGQEIHVPGEGHILTMAAQGSGKTTGIVIPTLLTTPASIVVTDPKGSITAQTKRMRGKGSQVVILNPWGSELTNDPTFGLDLGDTGFNPLQQIDFSPAGISAASKLTSLLLPDMPGTDPYWRQEARELLEWVLMFQAAFMKPEQRTLPQTHRIMYDAHELLEGMHEVAKEKPTNEAQRYLQPGAKKFTTLAKHGEGQFMGVVGSATTALKIYAAGSYLADHVSPPPGKGFRLSDLKSETLTVYLICPPSHLVSDDRKWLNLTLAMITQEIGKPGAARETILLMDEFPALGHLPNLLPALEQFREAGLRGHLIAQNPGQILEIYGEDGLRRLWGVAEYKQFFKMTDPVQAGLISSWLGQFTVYSETVNARGETSVSETGVPLVRAEELLKMPRDQSIIIAPEIAPIRAKILPYYQNPAWAAQTEANPYRRTP